MSSKKLLQAAAGSAGGDKVYVEDVFSTSVYEGDEVSGKAITNGIDLDGEGGMVWLKQRDGTQNQVVFDTERGAEKQMYPNLTDVESTNSETLKSFSSDGFTVGDNAVVNTDGNHYVSWAFRKQAGFFDVVKFTASGSFPAISHGLESTPGFVIYKCITSTSDATGGHWCCWHKSGASNNVLYLDTDDNENSGWGYISALSDSSATFYCTSGEDYAAYFFASGADSGSQIFGVDGDESIVSCGSYAGTGSANTNISLGWEPQFTLIKNITTDTDWYLVDSMRGNGFDDNSANDVTLKPNETNAESSMGISDPRPDGWRTTQWGQANTSGNTYVFLAVRRPMKIPESGTDVFSAATSGENATPPPAFVDGSLVDWALTRTLNTTSDWESASRLTWGMKQVWNATDAEASNGNNTFDFDKGWNEDTTVSTNVISYMFRRAATCYNDFGWKGDGSNGTTVEHGLGVTPEMVIIKKRSSTGSWFVYHKDQVAASPEDYILKLETTAASTDSNQMMNDTAPTATVITTHSNVYASYTNYHAWAFASVSGVSKVGFYTGTGSDVDVNCGFGATARWILIKRADSTGDWFIVSAERGYGSYTKNTDGAETSTAILDTYGSGFTVRSDASDINTSSGRYVYLAFA